MVALGHMGPGGSGETTMSQIAAGTLASQQALFCYFPTKAALL